MNVVYILYYITSTHARVQYANSPTTLEIFKSILFKFCAPRVFVLSVFYSASIIFINLNYDNKHEFHKTNS